MKLLLDTHIWLWSVLQPAQLSRRVSRALQDEENELWLSSISVWEVLMLCQKGRLKIEEKPESWITRALKGRVIEAPLTHEVALATARFKPSTRTPPIDSYWLRPGFSI